MKKSDLEKIEERVDKLEKLINGGKGSGNFGHAGRPGKRGGSGTGAYIDTLRELDGEPDGAEKSQKIRDIAKEQGKGVREVKADLAEVTKDIDDLEQKIMKALGSSRTGSTRELAREKDPVKISKRMYEGEKAYSEVNPKRWTTVADTDLRKALGIDRSSVSVEEPILREDYWRQNLEIAKKSKKK